MGTQGSITIYDEQGKDIANIVTQYDGYDLYEWVERFLSGKKITNGISNDYDFNGMSDLAARLIAALKTQRYKSDIGQPVKPGNVYLYSSPYQTDYHIDIRFGGEGQKPRMSVEQGDDWYDPHYHETQLPPLGEANVRMQGAESFNAQYDFDKSFDPKGDEHKCWYDDHQWVCYDIDARNDSSTFDITLMCEECGMKVDVGGAVGTLTKKGKGAETFNSYKVAPELSSYTKEELIDSKAGPQGTDTYDEMEYDPIAQDRLSAEELFPPYTYDYSDEVKARVLNKILLWHENMQLQSDEIADRMDRILWMLDNPDKFWEDWEERDTSTEWNYGLGGMAAESFEAESKKMCMVCNEKPVDYSHPNTLGALCSTPKCLHYVFDAESFASDEYRLCEICESTHHESEFGNSDDEEQTMTPKGKVCDSCFGDILFDDFQNADERDWAKEYLESKGFQQHPIEGSFEDRFASETTSTLKSIGYVAGTVGVGYLLFQRFLKDRLDKTMNPDS